MKPWMSVALLVAMSPAALAKPTPIELSTEIVKAAAINRGSLASVQGSTESIGTTREREYFEAKQLPINAFPCRIEPVLFSTVRLAQSCRLK
jgi:hypothetical protein